MAAIDARALASDAATPPTSQRACDGRGCIGNYSRRSARRLESVPRSMFCSSAPALPTWRRVVSPIQFMRQHNAAVKAGTHPGPGCPR